MIRTATFSLKFSNAKKQRELRNFMTAYQSLVNEFIDLLWEEQEFAGTFIPKEIQVVPETWLSARIRQCAGKQAFQVVKSQRKKKIKVKPVFNTTVVELDRRFIEFLNISKFDEFVKFGSLGNKLKIVCPIKHHKHYNELLSKGFKRKNSVRLREYRNNLYLDVFLEKEFVSIISSKTVGIDIGINKLMVDSEGAEYGKNLTHLINKIQRKKQKSKAFDRALKERDNYINKCVKELPLSNYVIEDIKNIGKNTKKRFSKQFRSKFQRWTYSKLLRRIELRAEVVGVQCSRINPAYTSQTCSKCLYVHESNRTGDIFLCKNCGYTLDADLNASINILNRSLPQEPIVPERIKT